MYGEEPVSRTDRMGRKNRKNRKDRRDRLGSSERITQEDLTESTTGADQ
jgi:hypothetical protein